MKKFIVFLFFCTPATISNAAIVQWTSESGGNGHYYDVVVVAEGLTWSDAKTAAENSTHLGFSGYLVTITSSDENLFVTGAMDGKNNDAWAGGFQPPESPEPSGNWSWTTGELWSYSNWRSTEPNNNGDENALEIMSSDHPLGSGWAGHWNDLPAETSINAYVIEYIPEPATLGLLLIGGLALLKRRRK